MEMCENITFFYVVGRLIKLKKVKFRLGERIR